MGVKGLWTVLDPVCEKKSLWELKDQVVAIDLSGWICENQSVDNHNSNLYLRNLFFRTSYMLLLGIKPIFVLEGKAPDLKYDTIKSRRKQEKNFLPSSKQETCLRNRLNSVQKQCEELLKIMGVCYVYSQGEAESLCAILNSKGIADGVISQDSDSLLYGAKKIYRNFNISSNGGTIEMYSMEKIEEKLSLGRNKLIAMSLLCGCDYNDKGVLGVGKETAMKYLSTVCDSEILQRFSDWRTNSEDINSTGNRSTLSKLEKKIQEKALSNPSFPFLEVQNEFLMNDTDVSNISYIWNKPNIGQFMMFAERKLAWKADYAMDKLLTILARWHLLFDRSTLPPVLELDCIVKKRNLRGVQSYEVKWKDFNSTTIEPVSILKQKYQRELEEFECRKAMKTRKKAPLRKKNTVVEDSLHEMTNRMCEMQVSCGAAFHDEPINCAKSFEDSLTVSDFECSATDLELSTIVESIVSVRHHI